MRITLSDLLSPHYCCSCGEIGAILCEYCKYNIVSEPFDVCIVCTKPTQNKAYVCKGCQPAYKRAWCIGKRDDALRQLIDQLKFERVRAAHLPLVELLDRTLPQLPDNIVVVPIPTISQHQRIRGYGHAELIARVFAQRRALPYREALRRREERVQRGASRKQRIEQAKMAYASTAVQEGAIYLLIDDVYTTGATLEYASRALLKGGASEVWVVALSRQPLEK